MLTRSAIVALCLPMLFGFILPSSADVTGRSDGWVRLAQIPYEAPPPRAQPVPDVSVPQNTLPLTPEELQRAEALLPLLEGKQEFWAMGEFVHLGEPVVPVVMKALTMPGPRIRYNAIETLAMLKSPTAAPALIETAKQANELPRIREHALRVAIRLDPSEAPSAIEVMAKDANSVIRKSAAFEARYVRHKGVIQPLIDLVADDERYVSISALQSLWMLTRHETDFHDWENSSKQDRQHWVQEWTDWWSGAKDSFEIPEVKRRRSS
ncbi:MAG: HEAT repeat domain-containing protein [Nitrospiraceae bacterium]